MNKPSRSLSDEMNLEYVENETYRNLAFTAEKLPKGEYENCSYVNCNFADSNLSGVNFADCTFEDCNLSLAKITNTAFKEVHFVGCKMVGLHFENCNPFLLNMGFEGCQLNLSSFYKLTLKKSQFKNCSLHEVDFTEADFTGSLFADCDLAGAIFDRTILEKADFLSAFNYAIDPENNKLKKAKFSLPGLAGLLHKYGIEVR